MSEVHIAWRNRIVAHRMVEPSALLPNPDNWRTHPAFQQRAVAAVLQDVGWVQDVILNSRTGHLVDGHLRVALAIERGIPQVPVVVVDLDPDEERLILSTFDPLAALAETNDSVLADLVAQVEVSDASLRALLDELAEQAGKSPELPRTDPDDVPPPKTEPVARPGDIFEFGFHRLMCGDATDPANVSALLQGEKAEWLWTDPPFGVRYSGKGEARLTIANDDQVGLALLLEQAFAAADTILVDGAPLYVAHPAGPLAVTFASEFMRVGWHLHQTLIWLKDAFVLGHADYHYRHEPILYGWKAGSRPWFGGRTRDSVSSVSRPRASPEHPTVKPVALVEGHLANSSSPGALGYDPFCGSGTTLIAAERLRRRCMAMEIDGRYVDVAVRRWQQHTAGSARLVVDGRSFAELEVERSGR